MTHLSFIIIKGISTILEHPSSAQGGDTGRFTITLTHVRCQIGTHVKKSSEILNKCVLRVALKEQAEVLTD